MPDFGVDLRQLGNLLRRNVPSVCSPFKLLERLKKNFTLPRRQAFLNLSQNSAGSNWSLISILCQKARTLSGG